MPIDPFNRNLPGSKPEGKGVRNPKSKSRQSSPGGSYPTPLALSSSQQLLGLQFGPTGRSHVFASRKSRLEAYVYCYVELFTCFCRKLNTEVHVAIHFVLFVGVSCCSWEYIISILFSTSLLLNQIRTGPQVSLRI